MYCTYATPGGHSLVGARIWVPAEQLEDPDRRVALGIPEDVEFATKPQLATQIVADMVADQTMPPWFAGDEVYGRSPQLRDYLEQQGPGYVLHAGRDFRVEMTVGTRERLDHLSRDIEHHLVVWRQRRQHAPAGITTAPASGGTNQHDQLHVRLQYEDRVRRGSR